MPHPDKHSRATTNDWYCFATIHGEPSTHIADTQIETVNREYWNGFILDAIPFNKLDRSKHNIKRYSVGDRISEQDARKVYLDRVGRKFPIAEENNFIIFEGLKFTRPTKFRGYLFPENTIFKNCLFEFGLDLSDTFFAGSITIENCTVDGQVNLNNTQIFGKFIILNSTFENDFTAEFCFIEENTNIEFSEFKRIANFSNSTFEKDISFRNSIFSDATKFNRATFRTHVPDFRGAKIHDATEMHDINWPDKPKFTGDRRAAAFEQVDRYSRLKQEMDRLKKSEDRLHFFRKELKARQWTYDGQKGRTFYYANHLYEKISRYGESIIFPIRYLIGLIFIGDAVYFLWYKFDNDDNIDTITRIINSTKISLSNTIPLNPYKTHLLRPEIFELQNFALQSIIILQSLLGGMLVFLVLLALRNRFGIR